MKKLLVMTLSAISLILLVVILLHNQPIDEPSSNSWSSYFLESNETQNKVMKIIKNKKYLLEVLQKKKTSKMRDQFFYTFKHDFMYSKSKKHKQYSRDELKSFTWHKAISYKLLENSPNKSVVKIKVLNSKISKNEKDSFITARIQMADHNKRVIGAYTAKINLKTRRIINTWDKLKFEFPQTTKIEIPSRYL